MIFKYIATWYREDWRRDKAAYNGRNKDAIGTIYLFSSKGHDKSTQQNSRRRWLWNRVLRSIERQPPGSRGEGSVKE